MKQAAVEPSKLTESPSQSNIDQMAQQDSPLSIAASITGILTFAAAVLAGFYAHAISLKNAVDTQAEVALALEKIDFLETETTMLENAYIASQIRHPDRKTGTGDFKYFHGLYGKSLERMRQMDRDLRRDAALITGGNRYDKISRVKSAAAWMKARERVRRAIEERKAESTRIFQIQLAILSAKIDELSYRQHHHNATCSIIVEELVTPRKEETSQWQISPRDGNKASAEINSAEQTEANRRIGMRSPSPYPISSLSTSSPVCSKGEISSKINEILTAIRAPVKSPLAGPTLGDYHFPLRDLDERLSTAPPV